MGELHYATEDRRIILEGVKRIIECFGIEPEELFDNVETVEHVTKTIVKHLD